jgi:hypothetical protein
MIAPRGIARKAFVRGKKRGGRRRNASRLSRRIDSSVHLLRYFDQRASRLR